MPFFLLLDGLGTFPNIDKQMGNDMNREKGRSSLLQLFQIPF
jgi:hypothetical protein